MANPLRITGPLNTAVINRWADGVNQDLIAAQKTIQQLQADKTVNPAPTFVDNEIPRDTGDHQHFILLHSPNPPSSLLLIISRVVQKVGTGNDFNLTDNTITLASALVGAYTMQAWYRY